MKNLAVLMGIFTLSTFAYAGSIAEDMIGSLYAMRTAYDAMYAPKEWKKKFSDYDLNQSFSQAVQAVNANPRLTPKEMREIFKNFIYATRDYHVSIRFQSTESASLPFVVKGAKGQVFLAYIDRKKLSEDAFPFSVGDELVTFGGKPVNEAINEVQAEYISNVKETDRALAEMQLTSRSAARGLNVPQGPITLGIKRNGAAEVSEVELIWEYKAEKILPRLDLAQATAAPIKGFRPLMNVDVPVADIAENPFNLGTRKSFIPDLGTKIWESAKDSEFYAYIYMNTDRKLIGYVRIPSYGPKSTSKAAKEFATVVSHFEKNADALVIDQVNNPGGSVFYLYALASMLSDKPLKAPLHRMTINQDAVKDALSWITKLEAVKTDEDAEKVYGGKDSEGYPISYELAQFELSYYRFLVSEWNAGHKLSEPYWIGGVNQINPGKERFTKPILLLTNELDFSGGDFFPAILQDNKRVTIMGTRTAGAGGYVNDLPILNNVGVESVRITGSIAERVNKNPIENLGVTPDIPYEMTPEDYMGNFAPFVKAIQYEVNKLAK